MPCLECYVSFRTYFRTHFYAVVLAVHLYLVLLLMPESLPIRYLPSVPMVLLDYQLVLYQTNGGIY